MNGAPLKLVLACNFSRDERIGTARVPLRLADELGQLGWNVSLVFAEDLPRVPNGHLDLATAPARMAYRLAQTAGHADIVDVAGFDAWLYARLARHFRPGQAIVSRSNGLWYRALAANGEVARGAVRNLASQLFQSHMLHRWERASMRCADLVLFGAGGDGAEIVAQGWAPPSRVAIVAPGVDEFFASKVPLDRRQGVAFVGGFLYRKGSDVLVAAMSQVMSQRPGVRLTLFGPGLPANEIIGRFEEGVRARVKVVEALPSTELARHLDSYAILVFPTRYEGFGLVVLEAMRAGLAVVTTPTGAGADVVRDEHNGLVIPFEDVQATAAAVVRLCDDDSLRVRLAANAVEEAKTRSWTRTAAELAAAYQQARDNAGQRARLRS
jgi:glycosyltransferase involved in cell wall biosynthesis